MSDNIKFIVTEVNKFLGRNYNLICFSALNSQDLLQILYDVLRKIQEQDGLKSECREVENPEQYTIYILSMLRICKYQPSMDPVTFRQDLIRGNSEVICAILTWFLSHMEVVRQRIYLSRFLTKIDIPTDYLGDPELFSFHEQYVALVEQFKTLHKEREIGKKNVDTAAEITADLRTMEHEKEAVSLRIEKMKSKAKTARHLLNAAQGLRMEKDKERDFTFQKDEESATLSKLQLSIQKLEHEMRVLKRDGINVTAQTLIQHLTEEVTVQAVVVKEKLPFELNIKRRQRDALIAVKEYSYLGPDDITTFRNKHDAVTKDIQDLIEIKVSKMNADKKEPFRQQAAAIVNVKRHILERLEKADNLLKELQTRFDEKYKQSRGLTEDIALRGEELKRYIMHLKSKSILYKRCRAELAGLKAENGVLRRTVIILGTQSNEVEKTEKNADPTGQLVPEDYTEENAFLMNLQLSQMIFVYRSKLTPLLNEIQALRQKFQDLEEHHKKALKSYNTIETTVKNSVTTLLSDVKNLKEKLTKNLEEEKKIKITLVRMKTMEERILEVQDSTDSNHNFIIKEELNDSIIYEEGKIKTLRLQKADLSERVTAYEKQMFLWQNMLLIFACKFRCAEENEKTNGIVVRKGDVETLVLL